METIIKPYFRVIIWDFDGVIIFSNEVREEGFVEIFKEYGNDLTQKLLHYHRINGGLSRYVKIRYFFEELLGESITDCQEKDLAEKFSVLMKEKLTNTKLLNPDWLAFMDKYGSHFKHHIASGSDGNELKELCEALGISGYFNSINGSPMPKNQLVAGILKNNSYSPKEVVLIGDAINDCEAAQVNNISFIGYNNVELKKKDAYLDRLADASL